MQLRRYLGSRTPASINASADAGRGPPAACGLLTLPPPALPPPQAAAERHAGDLSAARGAATQLQQQLAAATTARDGLRRQLDALQADAASQLAAAKVRGRCACAGHVQGVPGAGRLRSCQWLGEAAARDGAAKQAGAALPRCPRRPRCAGAALPPRPTLPAPAPAPAPLQADYERDRAQWERAEQERRSEVARSRQEADVRQEAWVRQIEQYNAWVAAAAGLLGCWAAGPLGCWAAGLLGRWAAGPLGRWAAGPLGCWAAGLLGRWAAGLRAAQAPSILQCLRRPSTSPTLPAPTHLAHPPTTPPSPAA